MKLVRVPIDLEVASDFVQRWHRHHAPLLFHKFSIGALKDNQLVGVVMVNRPVSRMRDDGMTLEVCRLATDGTPNACSFLYGAAAKATFALGYTRIGTYILNTEPGTSLRAAGWRLIGETRGETWNRSARPRIDKHPLQNKLLFEAKLAAD